MIFVFLFLTFSLCMTDSSGNLEKWYWWIYFQGSNRDTDTENGHIDAGCGGVELRDWDWFMCTAMKNWCFELWCWRRLLRVPGTARRSNQSIVKEISPGISLERMMLKLKQFFGHLMRRVDSLEKTLILGGIGGRRRRGQQRMRWLDGITDSMDVSLSELRAGSHIFVCKNII